MLGQARLAEPVIAAMNTAARRFVPVVELQARASEIIAAATGAEAGCVASGSAACLFLATLACIARSDVGAMHRLPDTTGLKNEVVVHRVHRNAYDHAIRTAGARFVEFGYASGLNDEPFEWELREAISERTAAVFYLAQSTARAMSLRAVVKVARSLGVPVIVDGAGTLPPPENLRRFIDEGADLVAFSGGKGLDGPSGSGFLAGRRDLVVSAVLQQQDMHVRSDTWQGPLGSPAVDLYPAPPLQGAGRMLKAGREEIVGLMVALQEFQKRDHAAEQARLRSTAQRIAKAIDGAHGISASVVTDTGWVPWVAVRFPTEGGGAAAAFQLLRDGEPRVYCHDRLVGSSIIVANPLTLSDDEVEPLIERFRAVARDVGGHVETEGRPAR